MAALLPSKLFAKAYPKASPVYAEAFAKHADRLLAEAGIDTALRISWFLAQCGHECLRFTVVRESLTYTSVSRILAIFGQGKHSAAITKSEAADLVRNARKLAERVYGPSKSPKLAASLGNKTDDDGWDFRGNGPIQTTGRRNHERAGFGKNPEDLAKPENILKGAIKFWLDNGLNALADKNDGHGITKRINGGYTGYADRVGRPGPRAG